MGVGIRSAPRRSCRYSESALIRLLLLLLLFDDDDCCCGSEVEDDGGGLSSHCCLVVEEENAAADEQEDHEEQQPMAGEERLTVANERSAAWIDMVEKGKTACSLVSGESTSRHFRALADFYGHKAHRRCRVDNGGVAALVH